MVLFRHYVRIEYETIIWYRNGEPHRKAGPAIEHGNGDKEWYRNGQLYHPQ